MVPGQGMTVAQAVQAERRRLGATYTMRYSNRSTGVQQVISLNGHR